MLRQGPNGGGLFVPDGARAPQPGAVAPSRGTPAPSKGALIAERATSEGNPHRGWQVPRRGGCHGLCQQRECSGRKAQRISSTSSRSMHSKAFADSMAFSQLSRVAHLVRTSSPRFTIASASSFREASGLFSTPSTSWVYIRT